MFEKVKLNIYTSKRICKMAVKPIGKILGEMFAVWEWIIRCGLIRLSCFVWVIPDELSAEHYRRWIWCMSSPVPPVRLPASVRVLSPLLACGLRLFAPGRDPRWRAPPCGQQLLLQPRKPRMDLDRRKGSVPAPVRWPECRTASKRVNPVGERRCRPTGTMAAALGVQNAELRHRYYRSAAAAAAAQSLSALPRHPRGCSGAALRGTKNGVAEHWPGARCWRMRDDVVGAMR